MSLPETDQKLYANFTINVRRILGTQNLTFEDLAQKVGLPANALSNALNSPETLGMATPARIARAFDIPIDLLFQDHDAHLSDTLDVLPLDEIDATAARLFTAAFKASNRTLDRMSDRPTIDSMVAWWKETDGDLTSGKELSPHFDLVRAADEARTIPQIHQIGPRGLTAKTLGSTDTAMLEQFLETLSASDIVELNRSIRTVAHSGVGMITPLTRKVFLQETKETVTVSFVRLMLPVKSGTGATFVLNYSTLLSESAPRKASG